MELWIRSQDRHKLELLNDRLLVQETTVNPHSHWYGIMVDGSYLAEYNSEERALEVLDDIQNLLQPKIKYIQEEPVESIVDFGYQITQNVDMKIQEINRIVYEMPKE